MKPLTPPLLHKLGERRARQRIDYRDGGLDWMLGGALVMIALGAAALAIWGGR